MRTCAIDPTVTARVPLDSRSYRWRNPLRRQPPAYSPLSLSAIAAGTGAAFRLHADPRPRLAESLKRDYQADRVVLCGSGTEALQLAIRAAARVVGNAGPVALPAFTCFEVAAAAVRTGARLALYDIDPHTLAPDLQSLEEVVRAGARIVVVSPLYGIPIDWTQVEARLAPYGAVAIEDAAQGHGAYWRGRPLGSWGRLSVLSFGRGKGWTGVRGGALLLRDGMTAETPPECSFAYEIRVLCLAAAQGALARPSLYGLPASLPWLRLGETHYREASTPRRMARAAAAILESTREAAEREAIARRESARALLDALPCGPVVWPVKPHEPGSVAGFVRLPIRLIGGSNGLLDTATATRLGLRGTYPSTLAELPAVRGRLSPVPSRWSGAQTLVRQLMTLPTHSLITSEEQDEIVRIISRCTP